MKRDYSAVLQPPSDTSCASELTYVNVASSFTGHMTAKGLKRRERSTVPYDEAGLVREADVELGVSHTEGRDDVAQRLRTLGTRMSGVL